MAIIISGISMPVRTSDKIIAAALKKAGMSSEYAVRTGIHKISLDTRKKNDIKTVSSVWAELEKTAAEKKICDKKDNCALVDITPLKPVITGTERLDGRIAIAGIEPAGMFAALMPTETGYRPVFFERGSDVDSRADAVSKFWTGGKFLAETNVQFGEGGAGTFSDGKLTTRIKYTRCRFVSSRLIEMGAPEEILSQKPSHISTLTNSEMLSKIFA